MSYKGNSIFKGKFFVWLAALCFLVAPRLANTYMQSILILVCFYAFAAVAWNLICGYAGTMSLGHSVYMGIGGYISTILLETKGVSPWIGMLIGAAFAHNFGLVGAAAKAATETEPAVAGGPAAAGKIAVIVCIVVLFVIAGTNLRRKKTAK